MLVSEAISEILRVVNNKNRSVEALLWLQNTLHELEGAGRWNFLLKQGERVFAPYLSLPGDFSELYEPVLISSERTIAPLPDPPPDPLPVDWPWQVPGSPWNDELCYRLKSQRGDYRVENGNLVFHSRWTTGSVLLRYYRKIIIPTLQTDVIDLPDQFVYNLAVYGAARHGLLGEDDYDRQERADRAFATTVSSMMAYDSRKKIANMGQIMGGPNLNDADSIYPFPNNYSL